MSEKFWWYVALAICLVLIGTIYFLWHHEVNTYVPNPRKMSDGSGVENYLKGNKATRDVTEPQMMYLRTSPVVLFFLNRSVQAIQL